MKFILFYLQFNTSLEGLGMFSSSAALVRNLRRYAATAQTQYYIANIVYNQIDTVFNC